RSARVRGRGALEKHLGRELASVFAIAIAVSSIAVIAAIRIGVRASEIRDDFATLGLDRCHGRLEPGGAGEPGGECSETIERVRLAREFEPTSLGERDERMGERG